MKNLVKNIAEKIALEQSLFLINLVARGSNRKPIFEIFVDSKEGVTTDICASFSRELKAEIELSEFAEYDYSLVVSSPGIDEPLKYLDQYPKHVGREFKISYDDGEDIKSIEAKLISLEGQNFVFNYKKENLSINFNKIKKAKVKISF